MIKSISVRVSDQHIFFAWTNRSRVLSMVQIFERDLGGQTAPLGFREAQSFLLSHEVRKIGCPKKNSTEMSSRSWVLS